MTKLLVFAWACCLFSSGCGLGSQTDIDAPAVSIVSPAAGLVRGIVAITAAAEDAFGIASVRFLVDGTVLLEDLEAPYTANWDTTSLPNGVVHTLTAEAVDRSGNKWQR